MYARGMRRCLVVVTLALSLLGCGKKHGGGKGTGGGGGGDREAPALPGQVQLLVDGKPVANADRAAAAAWTPLTSLLPANARDPKTWAIVEVHTHAGRITTMPEPASTQPGLVAAVFPGRDGGIDFGMFTADELAKHGTPKLVEMDVSDLRVKLAQPVASGTDGSGSASDGGSGGGNGEGNGSNRAASPDGPDLTNIKLTIKQKSGDLELTGADLGAIAKVNAPIGDTSTPGWDVASILAAKKITPTAKLIITDDSGASVTMTSKQLDPKTDLAFMKVNKQGQLRFRLFEKNSGGAWDVAGDLRGVTIIELVP